MPHKLIVGTTMSGKSTLARRMAEDAAKNGIIVIVYDPHEDDGWNSQYVTSDENLFFEYLAANDGKKIFAVMDEAETILSNSHRHNWWMFTRARHYGIESCAITLRPNLLAPTVRNNATEIYVFNLCRDDAKTLADEHNAPQLSDAISLSQGEFMRAYWKDKKKVVDKFKVF
jgi:hypothetical protein